MKIGKDDVGPSQWLSRLHFWADVIRADFQTIISRYLQTISTYLFLYSWKNGKNYHYAKLQGDPGMFS